MNARRLTIATVAAIALCLSSGGMTLAADSTADQADRQSVDGDTTAYALEAHYADHLGGGRAISFAGETATGAALVP